MSRCLLGTVAITGFMLAAGSTVSATESCSYSKTAHAAALAAIARQAAVPPRGEVSMACPPSCGSVAWVRKADVLPGSEGAAAGVIADKIYLSHGQSSGADVETLRIYDILTDTWSVGPPAFSCCPRSEGVGAVAGGKFYSIGGRATPALESYDPVTMMWALTPLVTARKGMAVGVINDRIHVVGGSGGFGPNTGSPTALHEVYDPAVPAWSNAAPLPVALADTYAAVAIGSKLYVFGGFDGGVVTNTTYIYDAPSDTWSTGAPMPTPRSNATAGVLCGQIFVIGGVDTPGVVALNVVEVYDPVTDSWCTGPPKPTPVCESATGLLSTANAIYVIGSGPSGAARSTHEALVLTPSSCLVNTLSTVQLLKGVRVGAGARFEWQVDPMATEYHLNSVTMKTLIGDPSSKLPPIGGASPQCTSTTTSCDDLDAIGDGTRLFYQVFSACGVGGADEGPI